jgi:hypothetical protein
MATTTRTSSRRQRILPARYQDPPLSTTPTNTTNPPRNLKRSLSPDSTCPPPSSKRISSSSKQEAHITLTLTAYPAESTPPRITVPLDIDVTDTPLPSWIDMTADYWTLWRHMYDKWSIQARFARINAVLHDDTGVQVADAEMDRLLSIRERLLTDHPDRQDIDLRCRRAVKRVWQFLTRRQSYGENDADFDCLRVEKEMGWDMSGESVWDQIGAYLMEQGYEGRIFIDPREYYTHFSWCVEDHEKHISDDTLLHFYDKFARHVEKPEISRTTVDCDECPTSTGPCTCLDTCLLCLPFVEGVVPVSPLSSLPSPPRTPGTQSLQSYFKGKRLSHPPLKRPVEYTDHHAINILLSFAGAKPPEPLRENKRGRSRRRLA